MKGRRKLSNHSNVFLFCSWLVPYDPIPGSHLFDQVHVARLPDISLSSLKSVQSFHLRVFSMLKEQHIPESVGDVSKISAQSTTLTKIDGCSCHQICVRFPCNRIFWVFFILNHCLKVYFSVILWIRFKLNS